MWALLKNNRSGFTIVELLIVIVVIGILAAITVVAFNGVQGRAVEAQLTQEASNVGRQIELYKAENGSYPSAASAANNGQGVRVGSSVDLQYTQTGTQYCATVTTGGKTYKVDSTGVVSVGACSPSTGPAPVIPEGYQQAPVVAGGSDQVDGYTGVQPISCPSTGGAWVKVPGNARYNKPNGFCVQQYAVAGIGGVATSNATSPRWTGQNITNIQTYAATAASGAHLLTEEEWMTFASNAGVQPENWGGTVGTGSLPRGASGGARAAVRIVLSNGSELFFDTGGGTANASREFTCYTGPNAENCGLAAQYHPTPANATYTDQFTNTYTGYGSLPTAGGYFYGDPRYIHPSLNAYVNSARDKGLGYLRPGYVAGGTTVHVFIRGTWTGATLSGLYSLHMDSTQSYAHTNYGFRSAI